MIFVTIYLSVTLVVVVLWLTVIRIPEQRRYTLRTTALDSLVVLVGWPLALLAFSACLVLSLLSRPRRNS